MDGYCSRLDYSERGTYYGGNGIENMELHSKIATEPGHHYFYAVGTTTSNSNFPLRSSGSGYYQDNFGGGYTDAFIAKFDDFQLSYSTYYGGAGDDWGSGIAIDPNNNMIYFCGTTSSSTPACSTCYCQLPNLGEFPMCDINNIYIDNTFNGGSNDAFIGCIDQYTELKWSSYVGGGINNEIDEATSLALYSNKIYMVGRTSDSKDNPYPSISDSHCYNQTNGLGGGGTNGIQDGFITRFYGNGLVGIDENTQNKNIFNIFPNPGTGIYYVEYDLHKSENFKLTIYNILGEEVFNFQLVALAGNNKNEINLSRFSDGLYFVKIYFENQTISKKIILQK